MRIEGELAFAIWDASRRTAFCARNQLVLQLLHDLFGDTCLLVVADPAAILAMLPQPPSLVQSSRWAWMNSTRCSLVARPIPSRLPN